jgi:5-methylcytosine-specific restriction endonuclease McrA
MRTTQKVLFGSVAMYRDRCDECGGNSLFVDGRSLCCNKKKDEPSEFKIKRISETEFKRSKIPNKIKADVLKQQNSKCAYCECDLLESFFNIKKCKYTRPKIHYDHFIPWCYSGDNSQNNIIAACAHCNHLKSNKVFKDFISAKLYIQEKLKNEQHTRQTRTSQEPGPNKKQTNV